MANTKKKYAYTDDKYAKSYRSMPSKNAAVYYEKNYYLPQKQKVKVILANLKAQRVYNFMDDEPFFMDYEINWNLDNYGVEWATANEHYSKVSRE